MNVLVLQPTNPKHVTARRADGVSLAAVAEQLLARLPDANPGMTFDIRRDAAAVPVPPSPSLYARHAAVRNYMLDTYLAEHHTHVLWVDSDMVDYPADLPTRLNAANPGGIAAPLALLDKCGPRFYDIGGFIERGRRFPMAPPYSLQPGPVWELDSVGCLYLAPAWLYQAGVRYATPPSDYYVEHWSVMAEARARGVRIVALADVVARHAWLPEYGLPLN